MKRIILLIWMVALFTSCNSEKKKNLVVDLTTNRIEVLDFFGKHRCDACVDIERNTKNTLEKYFKDELENKKIIFKLIQWDIPENDALVDKFKAAGTTLIIYRIKDGKEYIDDITSFAFKKCENDTAFEEELKAKLETALKKQ